MKCLDTYALVEIDAGNTKFAHILNGLFVIPDIILAEFYGVLYRWRSREVADYWHKRLIEFSRPATLQILIDAAKFRVDNKEKNMSFVDSVGYMFAQKHNLIFVTGDQAFKNLEGVEFITR